MRDRVIREVKRERSRRTNGRQSRAKDRARRKEALRADNNDFGGARRCVLLRVQLVLFSRAKHVSLASEINRGRRVPPTISPNKKRESRIAIADNNKKKMRRVQRPCCVREGEIGQTDELIEVAA